MVSLTRPLVTTQHLSALKKEVSAQTDRRGVWAAVTTHLRRDLSPLAAVLERRLDGAAWWPSDAGRDAIPSEVEEVARWCLGTGRPRVVPPSPDDGVDQTTVLLPLRERGEVTAVLRVAFEEPLPHGGLEELITLADFISAQLTNRAWEREAALLALLWARLTAAQDVASCASSALAVLASAVGADAGVLLEVRGSKLVRLAAFGVDARAATEAGPSDASADEYPLRRVVREHQIHFISYSELLAAPSWTGLPPRPTIFVPLEGRGPVRSVLALTFDQDRVPPETLIPTILAATDVISMCLSQLRRRAVTSRLDEILLDAGNLRGVDALRLLHQATLDLVPGVDVGFLFRRRDDGSYILIDAPARSKVVRLEEQDVLVMYRGTRAEWECGLPKPFAGLTVTNGVLLHRPAAGAVDGLGEGASADGCICVPFAASGAVSGFALLYGASPTASFDEESLLAARQVSAAAAFLQGGTGGATGEAPNRGPFTGFPSL